jgi:hypothetical protein
VSKEGSDMLTYDIFEDKEFMFYSSVEIVLNHITLNLCAFIPISYIHSHIHTYIRNTYLFILLSWSSLMWYPCCPCVCVSPPPLTFECLNQSMKLGVCIMAPEPISVAYFLNPSHQSVCLYVYPPVIARQWLSKNPPIIARERLGKNVTAAVNTHATIEELLDVSFCMWSISYHGK